MRIVMLSWEYPPKNIGGLSNHVYNLSKALTLCGHEIHVITCEEGTSPVEENDDGVIVHRVTPYKIQTEDFTKWIMQLNFSMIEECIRIIRKIGKIDIIHAHDWLSAYSAKALKWSFNIPMVSTIHATEEGRNNGIRTDMQRYISSAEWLLTYESWKIISCSNYMKTQIINNFNVAEDKVWVVPNGVYSKDFDFDFDPLEFRRNYALDEEKIIFFIGRHVFEKGIQLLIDAAPQIIAGYRGAKFVIAGTGPMTEELKYKVKKMGLENKILFSGYMNNETKSKLYRVANIAVFPSLYEPFGIVALEAMIAGCPVVVSNTGGLSELVEHRVNGMKMINGLTESLKDNVLELLYDDKLCEYIKKNAKESISERYTWEEVAKLTSKMYNSVKEEALDTEWDVDKKVFTEKKVTAASKVKRKRSTASAKKEGTNTKTETSKETKPRTRTRTRRTTKASSVAASKAKIVSSTEAISKTNVALSNVRKAKSAIAADSEKKVISETAISGKVKTKVVDGRKTKTRTRAAGSATSTNKATKTKSTSSTRASGSKKAEQDTQ
ncbi:glycosyltransferase family 4 protein [Clostridium arbusti]|uniref:glycosyltransferase family 4 protein n=1 Tax=Clostridium arbusti TaxID=1137848 RepID=UPI0002899054|nr:glycosyltransferase family 4 protein [Clostridium arbusti]